MILELLDEAVAAGARLGKACETAGVSMRCVERWRLDEGGGDKRAGPLTAPSHKLSAAERQAVVDVANSPEFRDKSPRQIVPTLADRGEYIASESTFYRVLHDEGQMQHRERARPRTSAKPKEHIARAPNQVWCWDITYLRSSVTDQRRRDARGAVPRQGAAYLHAFGRLDQRERRRCLKAAGVTSARSSPYRSRWVPSRSKAQAR